MSDHQDPDKPPTPKPGDPCMPIVESLLKHDVDSSEFLRAMAMAGPSERDEALRQIRQAKRWALEAHAQNLHAPVTSVRPRSSPRGVDLLHRA